MKLVNVVITKLQQTVIEVPDDFDVSGRPDFTIDQMLRLQSAAAQDATTTDIHVELVEPGRYKISALVEGVTFEQACTVASERFGPDEDYGFPYTLTDEGVSPA